MALTIKQRDLLKLAMSNGGTFTKSEAVDCIGCHYFANPQKHVGEVLTRMVRARLLVRKGRGVYMAAAYEQTPTLFQAP